MIFSIGQPLSNPPRNAGGMKIKNKRNYQLPIHALIFPPVTIARFGPARLVRHFAGHHELIGGSTDHQAAAREWCSLFAPEIVFAQNDRPQNLPVAQPPAKLRTALAVQYFPT